MKTTINCPIKTAAQLSEILSTGRAVASNVDTREVTHYESLANTWWDRQGPFWLLHNLNELRSTYLRDVLAQAFGRDPSEAAPLNLLR